MLSSLNTFVRGKLGMALAAGIVAGVLAALLTKGNENNERNEGSESSEGSENMKRPIAFLWGFTLVFLSAYVTLHFMKRPSVAAVDLETVMRHVKGGDPGF